MSSRDWVHEIAVWIDRTDWDAIEHEGDVVGRQPDLVDEVMVGYRRADTVEKRAAAILVLPDRLEPSWDPIMRDFLRLDRPQERGPVHRAVCKALCVLERDWAGDERYWTDLAAAMLRARELATSDLDHASAGERIIPGRGLASLRPRMLFDEVERTLGPPSAEEHWEDLDERELCYDALGLTLTFVADSLIGVRVSGSALARGLSIEHPSRPDAALRTPLSEQDVITRWGPPRARTRNMYQRPHTVAVGYPGVVFHFHASTGELVAISA